MENKLFATVSKCQCDIGARFFLPDSAPVITIFLFLPVQHNLFTMKDLKYGIVSLTQIASRIQRSSAT